MRKTTCSQCHAEFPMREMVSMADRDWCVPCAEQATAANDGKPLGEINRLVDPTVCVECGKDNGLSPLPRLVDLPVCSACEARFRAWPFPLWIKLFFVSVVAVVVAAFFYNLRFVKAYRDVRGVGTALATNDINRAARLSASAAALVPEDKSLRASQAFFEGLALLQENRNTAALQRFQACKAFDAAFPGVEDMVLQAQSNVAFDQHDYDAFLSITVKQAHADPTNAIAIARVASAYACKYVVTSNETFRQLCLDQLAKAQPFATPEDELGVYENRILYRLHAREIIDTDAFIKRFPNGWAVPAKETP